MVRYRHMRALLPLPLLCSIFYEHAQSQRREGKKIRICMHTHGDESLIGEKGAKINNGNTGFEKGSRQKTKLRKRF